MDEPKVIFKGDVGIRLDSIDADQRTKLEWLLSATSRPWKDNPSITVKGFKEEDGYLWIPRQFAIQHSFKPDLDLRTTGLPQDLEFKVKLDPKRGQVAAVPAMIEYLEEHGSGILVAGTGIGKTYLSYCIGSHFKTSIGVFIYAGHMVDNWVEQAQQAFGLAPEDIGLVQQDRCDLGKPITLLSIQSLLSRKYPEELYQQLGFIVADECLTGEALIITEKGSIPIKDFPLRSASHVLSFDVLLRKWEMKRIKRWMRRSPKIVKTITTAQGQILRCSENHPVMTVENGWLPARALKVGMTLLSPVSADVSRSSQLKTAEVGYESVGKDMARNIRSLNLRNMQHQGWITNFLKISKIEDGSLYENTYDLEVEDNHNFVANGILVHNCNRYGATEWNRVIRLFPGAYRLGISADTSRPDGLGKVIEWNLGEIGHTITQRTVKLTVVRAHVNTTYSENSYKDYRQSDPDRFVGDSLKYNKKLTADQKRNKVIIDELVNARKTGRRIIVFSQLRDHLDDLKLKCEEALVKSRELDAKFPDTVTDYLVGGMKKKDRDKAMLADIKFATYGYCRDAMNDPTNDTLFFATPPGNPLQPAGRLRDKGPEDRRPLLVVSFTEDTPFSELKWARHLKIYKSLGFTMKEVSRKID